MFWKVFAWLFCFIGISGEITTNYIYTRRGLNFEDSISTIVALPTIIALFAYAYQKKIWKSGVYFWKTYIFISIAINVYQETLIFESNNYPLESWIGFGIGYVIMIISYIGVYLYVFKFLQKTNKPLTT